VRGDADISPASAHTPAPPSERVAWLIALALALLGASVLAAVLSGAVGSSSASQPAAVAPPAVLAAAATPTAAAGGTGERLAGGQAARAGGQAARAGGQAARAEAGTEAVRYADATGGQGLAGSPGEAHVGRAVSGRAVVANPSGAVQRHDQARFTDQTAVHIAARWMEGFYPIYAQAQSTFGVNWLLLASIHRQESAFSTAPTTYHGLNFAGCCGGPMQFNVTNGGAGISSTWGLVRNAYLYGRRPAAYDHQTGRHPSIYDDFDSIMAAAWLLSSDGAGYPLDDSAWSAAYDYYGHDATGVTYADQVLARAIGWSQHGFCINCGLEPAMVQAVHEAYGAPVLASLEPAAAARVRHPRAGR
jgi:hypothetical protein